MAGQKEEGLDLKETVTRLKGMNQQLTEEDKEMSKQIQEKEQTFVTEKKLTHSDFNEIYSEAVKNFRLDFGVVCEKGRDEVIEQLPKAKDFCDKEKIAKEYLSCVELTRLKAAQRQQSGS